MVHQKLINVRNSVGARLYRTRDLSTLGQQPINQLWARYNRAPTGLLGLLEREIMKKDRHIFAKHVQYYIYRCLCKHAIPETLIGEDRLQSHPAWVPAIRHTSII